MRATIRDGDALSAVSPSALSAYARASGWVKSEDFGDSSDVYVGTGLPEIIVPRTQRLGDYPDVVARLIEIFAAAADMDELALYRDLVTADRDITRVRAPETSDDGTIALSEGANFVSGIRDIHMAAACSLYDPRPLYRTGTNREANEILQGMRLGQTEQGSYVVTLLSPVIPPLVQVPLIQGIENDDDPIEDGYHGDWLRLWMLPAWRRKKQIAEIARLFLKRYLSVSALTYVRRWFICLNPFEK